MEHKHPKIAGHGILFLKSYSDLRQKGFDFHLALLLGYIDDRQ